jgi:hypothetical protein
MVVEDIPLEVRPKPSGVNSGSVAVVTVRNELAVKTTTNADGSEERLFNVRWIIEDGNGQSGEVYVVNSFTEKPPTRRPPRRPAP